MELRTILEEVGFKPFTVIEEELSPEYLNKWGHEGMDQYIRRGKIIAVKPE